jgi:hypothetical protein
MFNIGPRFFNVDKWIIILINTLFLRILTNKIFSHPIIIFIFYKFNLIFLLVIK